MENVNNSDKRKPFQIPKLFLFIVAAFALGFLYRGICSNGSQHADGDHGVPKVAETKVWTCSMHPQITQPKFGKCPICAMDLIPLQSNSSGDDTGLWQLTLSERARKLADIEVADVERNPVTTEIRMVGKVDYDETRVAYITAWIPGRLDRMFVDYTGIPVKRGDHLVEIYSPKLYSAQQELLQSIAAAKTLDKSSYSNVKKTTMATVEAARTKLRLLGLKQWQIDQLEKQNKPSDRITIYSPASGIVIKKHALEGMYVDTGTRIYTVADLSKVWLRLDVYESDLAWIRYGQDVEFTTEAYPGEVFQGKIAFIDPVLDAKTRTVKIRVVVGNEDGRLKPDMFVRAAVKSKIAADGRVVVSSLAGKWMCPMHPDIIRDKRGSCDICGMPLESTESLGFVDIDADSIEAPVVIPATAPLITGKRAVVYIAVPGVEGKYEGREIVLGPRAGDYYIVKDGLEVGEKVVVNGNFKIDSAVQILAKPSMMNPSKNGSASKPPSDSDITDEAVLEKFSGIPKKFTLQLEKILNHYFEIQQFLSQDKLNETQTGAGKLLKSLEKIDTKFLNEENSKNAWMKYASKLEEGTKAMAESKNMIKAREGFLLLSNNLIRVSKQFGDGLKLPVIIYHCPMAFENKGADWLQNKDGVENPYFGSIMFKCGREVEVISSAAESGDSIDR